MFVLTYVLTELKFRTSTQTGKWSNVSDYNRHIHLVLIFLMQHLKEHNLISVPKNKN